MCHTDRQTDICISWACFGAKNYHLVGGGLAGVGVTLRIWVVVDILGVVVNIVAVVVVVSVAGDQVDDVEHWEEESEDTESADVPISWKYIYNKLSIEHKIICAINLGKASKK